MKIRGDNLWANWGQRGGALVIALILHGALWAALSVQNITHIKPSPPDEIDVIDVVWIGAVLPQEDPASVPVPEPQIAKPKPPEPEPLEFEPLEPEPPESQPSKPEDPAVIILATPETVTPTNPSADSVPRQDGTLQNGPSGGAETNKTYVPSRWALNPTLSDNNLKGFTADIDCMQSLSPDCAEMRKEVFAEEQLTETDLVWTKKYAHTGLPAEFYGMSERQIRERLGVPNAGENGQAIIPGFLYIDGPIWDALHGVNKGCKYKSAVKTQLNPMGFTKDCGTLRPAAKDEKYVIPSRD